MHTNKECFLFVVSCCVCVNYSVWLAWQENKCSDTQETRNKCSVFSILFEIILTKNIIKYHRYWNVVGTMECMHLTLDKSEKGWWRKMQQTMVKSFFLTEVEKIDSHKCFYPIQCLHTKCLLSRYHNIVEESGLMFGLVTNEVDVWCPFVLSNSPDLRRI